ncbi:hypothetical protein E3P89_02080 [Wallemia ichthyophaga]|uniref:Major facilitator superfamily (MFS) profile domain-containing protein n=1 Tax=Wallemia ichthyophaga TaxID=245174 RepID=A0A4T0HE51_WALIC|nr:hypothetical protein E3P98_00727 [Wallemia ichthyophaga]TIB14006.1 hypothetical protein E3P90_01403 [Wallemia ichthyophaga]TIB15929.1 hypothetical protein E3P93_01154 [Wallemia ichthyophaga]TIB22443.1 hypothetical protein E3P89_02080 [Wallemia ichthyophaga]TIB25872.1 hypothetical protein E3P88_01358 [Wallemia ichthyophaga]
MRDLSYIFKEGLLSPKYRTPLFYASIAVFGAVLYGYDGTYFTSVLATHQFKHDYGTCAAENECEINSSDKSIFTSIVFVGEFVGALSSAPIGDYFGRKGCFITACAMGIIGTILQSVMVGNHPIFIVGRMILGICVGIMSNATPLYLSEVVPTEIRAAVVGSWQCLLALGQVIGSGVGLGSKSRNDTGAYRIPICLNLIFVFIILAGQFIIPESPRWLVTRDKTEKAEKALWKIHGARPDAQACVDDEMRQYNQTKDDELQSSGKDATWASVFAADNRKKLFVVCGVLICQQISGIQIVFSYITVIAQDLELGSDPFVVTIGVTVVELGGVICSFFIVNRYGRRPLLMYTGMIMAVFLLIMGFMGVGNYTTPSKSDTFNKVVLAMYILFTFAAWGPLAWVCASELSGGRVKNKIMSLGTGCFWISAFVVTFTLPYLYDEDKADIGSMVSLIYGFLCSLTVVFVYFCIPETRGRSLEEIIYMFDKRVPTRHWDEFDTTHIFAVDEKGQRFGGEEMEHVENNENEHKLEKKESA